MPPASSARASAHRRPAPRRAAAPARPRLVLGGNVRWDRVGRIALLLVLGFILLLYIGPLHSYYSTWQQSKVRHAQLERVEAEHARLLERKRALGKADTLLRDARRLGMVRPGEREYVIGGLPGR